MKHKLSYFGITFGSVALLLALVHFWAGPFAPQPTVESFVAEKAASIRNATIDALKGNKPAEKKLAVDWDLDKGIAVVIALLGGIAIILAVIGFAKKESTRVAGGAAVLGFSAIAFQFIAMFAMALLVVLLIWAVLSSLGIE